MQLGTRFIKEKDVLAQKSISGVIKFPSYKEHRDFSLFIQHKPLVLTYTADNTYHINISIDKLEKTELATGGLYCSVVFKSLGTFFKTVVAQNMKEQDKTGKVYPYSYAYTYYDYSSGEVVIDSDSVLESATKISIFGPCTNPSYIHTLNGEYKTSGKINTTIPEGNKLVIDTMSIPYSIREYTIDNKLIDDLYEKSDFSTERFVMLGCGNNRITFTHETSEQMKIYVEGAIEYESV